MPTPFDLDQFVAGLERQRRRLIRLRPFSSGPGFRAACGSVAAPVSASSNTSHAPPRRYFWIPRNGVMVNARA